MKKEKKIRSERHQDLRNYFVFVQADTPEAKKYNYTKLVSREKAYEMVHGKMNEFGVRIPTLKHKYNTKEIGTTGTTGTIG